MTTITGFHQIPADDKLSDAEWARWRHLSALAEDDNDVTASERVELGQLEAKRLRYAAHLDAIDRHRADEARRLATPPQAADPDGGLGRALRELREGRATAPTVRRLYTEHVNPGDGVIIRERIRDAIPVFHGSAERGGLASLQRAAKR